MHKTLLSPLWPALYVAVFAAANIITAHTMPAEIGPFLVTWGTWIIGATFVFRDLIQLAYGRAIAYACIGAALVVSAVTSWYLGDPLSIVAGSAAAIALSESLDTEVFTRLKAGIPSRIAISGLAGSVLDSGVFAVIALSPLWSGIVPWEAIPNVILGQVLAKAAVQFLAAGAYASLRRPAYA